jgi:transposase-like protein
MGYKRKTDPLIVLATEQKYQLAVAHYKANTQSFRDVAKRFGVDKTTLCRRVRGTHKSHDESHAASQKLTDAAEAELEQYINHACNTEFPPTLSEFRRKAQELVDRDYKRKQVEGLAPKHSHASALGVSWHRQYLDRHPEFRVRYQRALNARAGYSNEPEQSNEPLVVE